MKYLIIVLFLFSCNVKKNISKKESTESRREIEDVNFDLNEKIEIENEWFEKIYREEGSVRIVRIKPRGQVNINKDGEFRGMADSLTIESYNQTKDHKNTGEREKTALDRIDKSDFKKEVNEDKKESENEKDVDRGPGFMLWAGIAIGIIVLIIGIRIINKFKF